MLSDKVIRQLRATVKTLVEVDPVFSKIDAALGERQTLRERNVKYSVEIAAGLAENERLRMVLREHGLQDYIEVPEEAPGVIEARKGKVKKALVRRFDQCHEPGCDATAEFQSDLCWAHLAPCLEELGEVAGPRPLVAKTWAEVHVCPGCGAPISGGQCENGHPITVTMNLP